MRPKMRILEMYTSIQGEGPFAGAYSLFVRVAGCNLRCPFCDTKYAWDVSGAKEHTSDYVLNAAKRMTPNLIVVTGGEPLLYKDAVVELCRRARRYGFTVQVETNGTIPFPSEDCIYVVSPKDVPVSVPGASTHVSWYDAARAGHRVYFKFLVDWKRLEEHFNAIDKLVDRFAIPKSNIYVMPLTYETMNLREIVLAHSIVAREAIDRGYNFSPRLHIILGLK